MWRHWILTVGVVVLLSSCGGDDAPDPAPPDAQIALDAPAPVPDTARIQLHWTASASLQTFSVWLAPGQGRDFEALATGVSGDSTVVERGASWRIDYPTARIRVRGCTADARCVDSNDRPLQDVLMAGITRIQNGTAPALSGDGRTLLLGTGVYFRGDDGRWGLESTLPTALIPGTQVGSAAALSEDGQTVVVGYSQSSASGPARSGALIVHTRDPQHRWTEQAMLRVPTPAVDDHLGARVAISADGRFVAASGQRRVHLFARDAQGVWQADGVIQCSPGCATYLDPRLGLVLSPSGLVLAVAAYDGNGVPGQQGREFYSVRVFARSGPGGAWQSQGQLRSDQWPYDDVAGPPIGVVDHFGVSGMAFDHAGTTLAIGAPDRAADSDPSHYPGAVYVFKASAGRWQLAAQINNAEAEYTRLPQAANDAFGAGLSLSGDGKVLASTACGFYAPTPGLNRNQPPDWLGNRNSDLAGSAGGQCIYGVSTYVYTLQDDQSWKFTTAINPLDMRTYGEALMPHPNGAPALSADGGTLALYYYSDVTFENITVVY